MQQKQPGRWSITPSSPLRLKRVVAMTTYDNRASIGVMEKLGMRIERNPFPDPEWAQVTGILEAPGGAVPRKPGDL